MQRPPTMRPRRRSCAPAGLVGLLLALFALLAGPPAEAAQSRKPFDPFRDLEGYQECMLSEYSDLYELRPFEERKGESLTSAELEALREAWRAERVRVLREIERIETDPAARLEYRFRRQLRRHPYFSQQALEIVPGHAPFLIAVQRTLGAGAADPERVAATVGPWLTALRAAFDEELARPLELRPRPGFEALPVVVLASRGAYDDYLRIAWGATSPDSIAHYEEKLHLLVLHLDRTNAAKVPADARLHDELREAVRFLLHAHNGAADAPPEPFWLEQGLADALAGNDGRSPASLRQHLPSACIVRPALDLLQKDALRRVLWPPLGELLRTDSWEAAAAGAARRAREARTKPLSGADYAFRIACAALVHHLLEHDDEAVRSSFLAAVKAALAGGDADARFEAVFAPAKRAAIEREVVRHTWADAKGLFPGLALDDAELERILASLPPDASDASDGAGGPETASAPAVGSLADGVAGEDALFALAVARARRGAAELAAAGLDELVAGSGPLRERAALELDRVQAWIALRDRFLEHLAAGRHEITIEHDGAPLRARVASVADGSVRFDENRRGIAELGVEELDPLELAKEMATRKLEFEADWSRAYPYVLHGLGTWKSLLGASPREEALRADAEGDYPARAAAIEAAARVDALSGLSLDDPERAEAALDRIAELWSESRGLEFVAALEPRLVQVARAALGARFRAAGLSGTLHGELEELSGGALRLTYDFASEEQLLDLPAVEPGVYPLARGLPDAKVEASSGWRSGRLAMRGESARRHVLDFEGPMRLAYTYRGEGDEGLSEVSYFLGALCASPDSYLASLNGFYIELFDKADAVFHRVPERASGDYFLDTDYAIELTHDGEGTAEMLRLGESVGSVPADSLRSGGVLLWTRVNGSVLFDDLVIEGRPTRDSLDALRESWTRERLVELGLGGG